MREIKFRAWDAQSTEWMYAGLKNGVPSFPLTVSTPLHLGLDSRVDAYENTVWGLNDDELIWCQFTGLIDKNGVEIYEGDILARCFDDYNEPCEVFYDYAICCARTLKTKNVRPLNIKANKNGYGWCNADGGSSNYDFRVIGNIYEHAHLIDNK